MISEVLTSLRAVNDYVHARSEQCQAGNYMTPDFYTYFGFLYAGGDGVSLMMVVVLKHGDTTNKHGLCHSGMLILRTIIIIQFAVSVICTSGRCKNIVYYGSHCCTL